MLTPDATIFCDMDGVLVDFFAGAQRIFSHVEQGRIPRLWRTRSRSIPQALAWIEDNLGPDFRLQTREELDIPAVRKLVLSAIAFDPGTFFAGLPPLADGLDQLWPALLATGHEVKLLSAPIGARRGFAVGTAEEAKRAWAAQWLTPTPEVLLCPSRKKQQFARAGGPANLLIDDRASTIERWRAAGGIGILHAPGGSAQTVPRLNALRAPGR